MNKKRLLNKMEKYSTWVRNKYKDAGVKDKMVCDDNGTEHEITEEKWNFRLDQLANRAMVPEERNDIVRFIDFRFNWNERSKVREAKVSHKSEHMPVKTSITSSFMKPHRVYLQACSLDEFNFVFNHLRMGSTSNYHKEAIKCLMMMYYAKQLVELNKCQEATAAVSNL
jgi:hypothetical protein